MGVTVKVDIPVQKILNSKGLGKSGKAWKFAGARFKLYCDQYVPMQTGTLKNTAVVVADGSGASVTWVQPYSHYQYTGLTMGPNVLTSVGWRSMAPKGGKYYTGGKLTYNDGGQRGSKWDERMMAEKGPQFIQDIATYVGGVVV